MLMGEKTLKSTERLSSSTWRLNSSHRTALETEGIGSEVWTSLKKQRQQIENTRETLDEADGYVNRSLKTLKETGKWYLAYIKIQLNSDSFPTLSKEWECPYSPYRPFDDPPLLTRALTVKVSAWSFLHPSHRLETYFCALFVVYNRSCDGWSVGLKVRWYDCRQVIKVMTWSCLLIGSRSRSPECTKAHRVL